MDARILALAEEPRALGAVKLQGAEGYFRIRVGDYRVVYAIEDDVLIVLVVRIGHRRDGVPMSGEDSTLERRAADSAFERRFYVRECALRQKLLRNTPHMRHPALHHAPSFET